MRSFWVAFFSVALSSCAPLRFTMYIRNLTSDTTTLTFLYKTANKQGPGNSRVRFADSVLRMDRTLRDKLHQTLNVITIRENQFRVAIPPRATVCLSDLVYPNHEFGDKTLIFTTHNKSDTVHFNYPYRRIKGVKHKRVNPYNFFYRTLLYYDILPG
jgi:hypothetical protein